MPPDVTLAGLSAPRFDGENYFRAPTAPRSRVDFTAQSPQFAQLEYQLYTPSGDVTGVLKLDGRVLDRTTFPAGQFIPNVMAGAFVSAGAHRFTLEYLCGERPCTLPRASPPGQPLPLRQYWTRLEQLPDQGIAARQDAGLGAERWWLNAPGSPLKITGAGPLYFDGVSFVRRLPDGEAELSWTQGKVLSASMLISAPQPFRVTTRAGREVAVQSGTALRPVSPAVSLSGQPTVQAVTVQVDCLGGAAGNTAAGPVKTGSGCAFLYAPQVAVLTAPPASGAQVAGASGAALLLILGLWRWLGLRLGQGLGLRRGARPD